MAVSAGSATRSEESASLLPWLLCQPGEKQRLCSSHGSLSFPAASWLAPCLPWVQRTLCTRYSKTTGGTNRISCTQVLPALPFCVFTLHPVLRSRTCRYSCCLSHLQPPYPTSPGHPDSGIHPLRSLSLTPLVETTPLSQPGYSFQLVLHPEVLRTCVSTVSNPLVPSIGLRIKPQLSFLWTQGRMWFSPSYQPRDLLSSSTVYHCSSPWGRCPNSPLPRMFLVLVRPTSLCPSKFICPDLQYVSIFEDLKNKVFKVGLIPLWQVSLWSEEI